MPSLGSYLQPVIGDIGNMKDYAHASRLYADNVFSLAPKAGWMYYVVFDIDPSAITDVAWANKQKVTEVGMLVKAADLPKFSIQTEVVNQYNRKTVIQKGMTYNPINITMHDDQSNVVHNMWLNYYRYYYADTIRAGTTQENTPAAYENNKYLPADDLFNPVNYGLNSQLVVAPFFRSVTIYQLNRRAFTSFKLINPLVASWDHDKLDQTQGGRLAESRMAINYEAVFYGQGLIKKDTPTGFAIFHYDTSPSPLSIAGGGNNSLFGPGGTIPGALDIFGNIENIGTSDNPLKTALGTTLEGINLVRNIKNVTADSLRAEGYSILNTALQKAGQGGLNGLGINLDLQKGSNYATAGQFLGTPVSVINATGVGKDGAGNYSQAAPNSNGTKPTTSNPSLLGAAATALFGAQKAVLDKVKSFLPSSDQAPSGDTPSAGQYFPPPQPLSDTTPFTASVDENSSPADIQASLSQLNSSWASDNSYVNSQAPDPSAISDRLSAATSEQERAAIQADADSSYNTIQGIQSTVDAKYQSEFSRLSNLLNTAQTKTSGSDSTQSTPDESPTTPSPESDAVPPPNEDI